MERKFYTVLPDHRQCIAVGIKGLVHYVCLDDGETKLFPITDKIISLKPMDVSWEKYILLHTGVEVTAATPRKIEVVEDKESSYLKITFFASKKVGSIFQIVVNIKLEFK